jgi:hypothetical protein
VGTQDPTIQPALDQPNSANDRVVTDGSGGSSCAEAALRLIGPVFRDTALLDVVVNILLRL